MKIQADPRLPDPHAKNWPSMLNARLYELFRSLSQSFNTGYFWETEDSSIPTSGTWAQGDICRNTAPSEAGTAGSKYVVIGWICAASGSPGIWLPMRVLTGN